jgi:lysophospholipase L1-like esterase
MCVRPTELFKNLLLALVSTAVFLGALEGISRWVHPVRLPYPVLVRESGRWRDRYEHDDRLFWRLKPNLVENGRRFTNALGLRGPEIPEKRPDEFRILSLGESTTFGWNVSYEQSYSALLQELLPSLAGRRVRVVNAGVPSYTSFQAYHYLRERGLDLEPDAVLLYFGANDFAPAIQRAARSARWLEDASLTDPELYAMRRRPLVRLNSELLEHSNFYRWLALPARPREPPAPADPPRSRLSLSDRRRVLSDFLDLCEAAGVQLVIVVPWYREFSLHEPLLREFAAANGVPIVDLPALLTPLPQPRERYFQDIIHPNAAGHRLIARALAASLRELWGQPRGGGQRGPGDSADGAGDGRRTGGLRPSGSQLPSPGAHRSGPSTDAPDRTSASSTTSGAASPPQATE